MVGLIIAKFEGETEPVYGTGFLFYTAPNKKRGVVLTCAHNLT
jgi:hypothetical protein